MRTKKTIVLDYISQNYIELTEEDFHTVYDAVHYCIEKYPRGEAEKFYKNLKKLKKKLSEFYEGWPKG